MPEQPYQITRDKLPTPEEVSSLLKKCDRLAKLDLANGRKVWVTRHLLVHLACGSGLRASEIALLREEDVPRRGQAALLMVRRGEGERHRTVQVGRRLAGHIAQYRRIRRAAWGELPHPQDLLLPGRGGLPYTTAALCFRFRKAVEAAHLKGPFSLRNARHFYAAYLLAKTADLRFVQRQMGHANQNMTTLYFDVAPFIDPAAAGEAI